MLHLLRPTVYSGYSADPWPRMRVLPKLTIDKILLLSVLLSAVYLILYGIIPPDGNAEVSPASRKRRVRPGSAFIVPEGTDEEGDSLDSTLTDNLLDFRAKKPTSSPAIKYPEILGSSVQRHPRTCDIATRLDHLRQSCKRSPARTFDYDQGDRQLIRYAVVDHERKLFYCLIGKAGSKSWLKYMVDSKPTSEKGHLRHNSFLETVGLEMLRNVPLDKVNKQFKDYFKFLVVRHPLQRAVSAYYETVVLHEKYKNADGSLLNFTEFASAVTSELMDENPHWRRYINRCKVCKLDYQYVIKTETMDDDIQDFNKFIGNRKGHSVQYTHQNRFVDEKEEGASGEIHHYKYDKTLYTLQRKNPDLMKKFINVYAEDMQLFGYKWDWARGISSCSLDERSEECC